MPCTFTGSIEGDRLYAAVQNSEKLAKKLTELTALLCAACAILEDLDGLKYDKRLVKFYAKHRKIDTKRRMKEKQHAFDKGLVRPEPVDIKLPHKAFFRHKYQGAWEYAVWNAKCSTFMPVHVFVLPVGATVYNVVWKEGNPETRGSFVVKEIFPITQEIRERGVLTRRGDWSPFSETEYTERINSLIAEM